MIEFSVTSSGLKFDELAQKLSSPLKQKLIERLTDIAFAAAFWGAPVRTGYLASTVYKQISDSEGVVGVAASYAKAVVEGTAPHEIRPANGGVLAFMIAGKMIFTPIVHHPGTKPNQFMQNAFEETKSKVDATFAELWLELVGG
jgi:HK97 gp10 family phage protein